MNYYSTESEASRAYETYWLRVAARDDSDSENLCPCGCGCDYAYHDSGARTPSIELDLDPTPWLTCQSEEPPY